MGGFSLVKNRIWIEIRFCRETKPQFALLTALKRAAAAEKSARAGEEGCGLGAALPSAAPS